MHLGLTQRLCWALAVVVAVAACSDDGRSSPTTVPTAATPVTTRQQLATTSPPTGVMFPPVPSSAATPLTTAAVTTQLVACRPTGEYVVAPSGRRSLLRVDGLAGPSPTIVVLHGYTGTPTGIERFAELTAAANASGVAVAYPEGTPTPDGGFGWTTGAAIFATEGVDDVTALAEVLDTLVATGCVDPARVVLVGESNGGGMALVTACSPQLAGRFTRVVLVNAAVDNGVLERWCTVTPLPLTAVAGALDETVPLDGNGPLLPVADWFAAVAPVIGGCAPVTAAPPLDANVSRVVGTACAACNELLVVADGTHTWPGSSRGVNDLVPGTFDLNALLVGTSLTSTSSCLTGLP